MSRPRKPTQLTGLRQAFDAVRFGREKTLNLRESLPTRSEATRRAECWLRERQAMGVDEVLIVTGRGNNSEGGVSPVREGVVSLLNSLRRLAVVKSYTEHTQGSFVVSLAPFRDLVDAPRRRRERTAAPPPAHPETLAGLDAGTKELLRDLAERALEGLGIADTRRFLQHEMLKQFAVIARAVPEGPDRERRLRDAVRVALDGYE